MTETEYIDVKNLAAVENALNTVRSLHLDDSIITNSRLKTVPIQKIGSSDFPI